MTDDRDLTSEASETDDEAPARDDPTPAGIAANGASPSDAVAAYLLDALDENERVAFETYLATSPETQAELRQLAPVVSLLPKLFELETNDDVSAPAPALRERIIQAATAEEAAAPPAAPVEAESRARTIRTAPEVTGPFEHKRPAARPAGRPAARRAPAPLASIARFPTSWLIAAGLTVVAIGAIIWALALQGRIDSKNREIAAQAERITSQESEIAELRENANATSFTLSAASNQPAGATGTLLYSLQDNIGVLYVRDLPALEDELVYQLWYLDDESESPRPGGTFRVDRNGAGFIVVESDTPVFDGLALTVEPEGGSDAPTSGVVLQGRLGGARG
ncbi:MAG: anti-sigma factor [Thermomicrobiales bacterium]|nr:anti-sigma factor [Thermomicrobiales bacterium]